MSDQQTVQTAATPAQPSTPAPVAPAAAPAPVPAQDRTAQISGRAAAEQRATVQPTSPAAPIATVAADGKPVVPAAAPQTAAVTPPAETPEASQVPKPEDVEKAIVSGGPSTLEEFREAHSGLKQQLDATSQERESAVEVSASIIRAVRQQGLDVHLDPETGAVSFPHTQNYAAAKGVSAEAIWESLGPKDRELATENPKDFAALVTARVIDASEKKLRPTAIVVERNMPAASPQEVAAAEAWAASVKQQDGQSAFPDFEKWKPVIDGLAESKRLPDDVRKALARHPRTKYDLLYGYVRGKFVTTLQRPPEQKPTTPPGPPGDVGGSLAGVLPTRDTAKSAADRTAQISGRSRAGA